MFELGLFLTFFYRKRPVWAKYCIFIKKAGCHVSKEHHRSQIRNSPVAGMS